MKSTAQFLFMSLIFISRLAWSAPDPYQEVLMSQLIAAEPGAVIEIPEGRFNFDRELSIAVDDVTLRGKGPKASVLVFKGQESGAQGLLVTGNHIRLEGFGIEDTKGDGIKAISTDGLTIHNLRVEWTTSSSASNGGYGLYPVKSANILIEDSEIIGASDAGIYVGQSRNAIVRRNIVHHNVAGIEIENTVGADVLNNYCYDNTAGILVFNLPDLSQLGSGTRVFHNLMVHNNTANFSAPINTVADVPQGTGLMLLAAKDIEVFENFFAGNNTTNLIIVNYEITTRPVNDPTYDPYVEGISVHNNTFLAAGTNPNGGASESSQTIIEALSSLLPKPFPDAIYDGSFNPKFGSRANVPAAKRICLKDDQEFRFVNLDLPGEMQGLSSDLAPFQCELQRLPAIVLRGL